MWIKRFADGTVIREDRDNGVTWLSTPLTGIAEVQLKVNGQHSPKLRGYDKYWHSRTGLAKNDNTMVEVAERIQGQRPDGQWHTIEWNGKTFVAYTTDRAIGRPVKK